MDRIVQRILYSNRSKTSGECGPRVVVMVVGVTVVVVLVLVVVVGGEYGGRSSPNIIY